MNEHEESFGEEVATEQKQIDAERERAMEEFSSKTPFYRLFHPDVRRRIERAFKESSGKLLEETEENLDLIRMEALSESRTRYEVEIERIKRDLDQIENPGVLSCRSKEQLDKVIKDFKDSWGVPINDPTVTRADQVKQAFKYGVLDKEKVSEFLSRSGKGEENFLYPFVPLGEIGVEWTPEELDEKVIKAASSELQEKKEQIRQIDQQLSQFTINLLWSSGPGPTG